jgi:hypothetical protein
MYVKKKAKAKRRILDNVMVAILDEGINVSTRKKMGYL